MTDIKQTPPPESDKAYDMHTDSDTNPRRLYLEIPIGTVADDESINGVIFMLGFFENAKNEAIALVRRRRAAASAAKIAAAKGSIITLPSGGGAGLKVH